MQGLWTEEGDARLRELAEIEKLSAAKIAEKLGVTRNAVIGRCHRAGIQLQSVPHPSYSPDRPPVQRPRKRVLTPGKPEPKPPKSAFRSVRSSVPLEQPAPTFTYTGPGYTMEQVWELDGCRHYVTPHEVEPTLFCGEPKVDDKPYCAGHCSIAYEAAKRTDAQRESSRRAGLAYVRAIRKAKSDARQPVALSIAARIDEYGVAAE